MRLSRAISQAHWTMLDTCDIRLVAASMDAFCTGEGDLYLTNRIDGLSSLAPEYGVVFVDFSFRLHSNLRVDHPSAESENPVKTGGDCRKPAQRRLESATGNKQQQDFSSKLPYTGFPGPFRQNPTFAEPPGCPCSCQGFPLQVGHVKGKKRSVDIDCR